MVATTAVDNLGAMDRLTERIGDLHSSPSVAQKILSLTGTPDYDMGEVAACLERDPALSAKILRVVNSSRFGLAHRVGSVRQAAAILGQRSLRMFSVTFSLVDTLTKGPMCQIYSDYWQRALVMATAASRLSMLYGKSVQDDAYTSGLLADIGLLVLAQFDHDDYMEVYESAPHGPDLLEAEESLFEFNHAQLGAHLLRKWDIPEWVVAAVENHHSVEASDQPLPEVVRAGNLMADLLVCPETQSLRAIDRLLQEHFQFADGGFLGFANACLDDIKKSEDMFNTNSSVLDDSTFEVLESLVAGSNGETPESDSDQS